MREIEREKEREIEGKCVCVCVCEREREREISTSELLSRFKFISYRSSERVSLGSIVNSRGPA